MISKVAEAEHFTCNYGTFVITIYKDNITNKEHILLKKGDVKNQENVLCRIASECITGMVLNSSDCDCDEQMSIAMSMLQKEEKGILILLRQEGRGHGLTTKIQALANKNKGHDTFIAVEMLGKKPDKRNYSNALDILILEKVKSVKLITNNPDKLSIFDHSDIDLIERIPLVVKPTCRTKKHLKAKKDRGHLM